MLFRSLVLTVTDNGVGIAADDLARIGQPFFQARAAYDRKYDGTGLGFSIVKGFVDLHGGTTQIESRLGEGTCVTIRLPVSGVADRRERAVSNVERPSFDRAVKAIENSNKKIA